MSPANPRAFALACAAAVPPLFLVGFHIAYAVDVPRWDQWDFAPFLARAAAGELGWRDFWAPHNEHRIALPRLAMLAAARLSGWNLLWEARLNLALGGFLFLLYAGILRRGGGPSGAALALTSVLAFSVAQWENWFLGWQMQIFMNLIAAAACLWILSGARGALPIVAAAALAVSAALSFANGLLLAPMGAALLYLRGLHRGAACWLAGGAAFSALYVHGLAFGGGGEAPGAWTALHLAYPLAYIGGPVWPYEPVGAVILGALGLAAWLWRLHALHAAAPSQPDPQRIFWAALGAYALGSACLTAFARGEDGLEQALSARYVTIALVFWISLIGLWRLPGGIPSARIPAFKAAATALALAACAASLHGAWRWTERHHAYTLAREELVRGAPGDHLHLLLPGRVEDILDGRALLIEHRWGIFRTSPDSPRL